MRIRINRFPIFALWCREAALQLGYDEGEARSLALGRAKLGAAAVIGFRGKSESSGKHEGKTSDTEITDLLPFAGMNIYITEEDGKVRACLRSGGSVNVISPERFDKEVIAKIPEGFEEISSALARLAKSRGRSLQGDAYYLYQKFAPMVLDNGKERKPKFGEKAIFDTEKVEALIK